MTRSLVILGSTGSIGTQAIEVVKHAALIASRAGLPPPLRVVGLAAGKNAKLVQEQARELQVSHVALADEQADMPPLANCRVLRGKNSAEELVASVPCDIVLAAMVGSQGLPATLQAVQLGRDIALANKETLVAAGSIMIAAAKASGSKLLPVDSEHAALWQCFAGSSGGGAAPPHASIVGVKRAILTASGGPFRTWTQQQIEQATLAQALQHPTWNMGAKVTIDSAGLMNKALELIEAHWLFGLSHTQLGVLVHPQSIVHAMAELHDGSSVAQLAPPDMRVPIQRALFWPTCEPGLCAGVDWSKLSTLQFELPDLARFPALGFAQHVMQHGGSSGAILNAANEEAVAAFMQGNVRFGAIARVVQATLERVPSAPLQTLHDVHEAEERAREVARTCMHAL
jgi:1-deoxy-D-xylulose-5-phosphate reductoisomerase